ncbi:MAG: hypothetical protein SWE60_25920, partial [Thermodesulfobacteriota bacterium]|nr:hypothetical protein [Thermodesulfobacteriota bacterium]
VTLQKRDLKGSKLRCLMLTSLPRNQIVRCLTELVRPYGVVHSEKDKWMPQGLLEPEEARLGETQLFLEREEREAVTNWWLEVTPGANTPNWDLVAACSVEGKKGLILIEAKAHTNELDTAGKRPPTTENGKKNHEQIDKAIKEANDGLNAQHSGWALSRDTHYQLSNRFAWSWKLASMGIPVILVYLGFLNADEMRSPFPSVEAWTKAVHEYSKGIVPDGVWESKVMVGDTPIHPVIRSLDLEWRLFHGAGEEGNAHL